MIVVSLLTITGGGNGVSAAEVKYIPVTESGGVFNVVYSNAGGSRVELQILDPDGNALYQDISTGRNFNRNFRLSDPDSYPRLVFVIRDLNDRSCQRFAVEAASHLVEEVKVEEVK